MSNPKWTSPGSHSFAVENGIVVTEYYHFGENVAYEYAMQVRLDQSGQAAIAKALGLSDTPAPEALCMILKDRFITYDAVREYADAHAVPYELVRDFQP